MLKGTHLGLNSLVSPHTDGNDDQHEQVCHPWVIGETAKNPGDLATGLGKIRFSCHSCTSFFCMAFASTLNAWEARSFFEAGRFFELRANFLTDVGFFFGVAFDFTGFFLPVVRRDFRALLKRQTTLKRQCRFGGQSHRRCLELCRCCCDGC